MTLNLNPVWKSASVTKGGLSILLSGFENQARKAQLRWTEPRPPRTLTITFDWTKAAAQCTSHNLLVLSAEMGCLSSRIILLVTSYSYSLMFLPDCFLTDRNYL